MEGESDKNIRYEICDGERSYMNLTLIGCELNWSSVVDEARVFMDLDGEWAL